jgi:hypothetical protein
VEDTTSYGWHSAYREAVLETAPAKMPARINAAQKALQERLNSSAKLSTREHVEIENARKALGTLKAES